MRHVADGLTYLKLAAVTMIWGGTFVAGRYLADQVHPLLAATLRFTLASAALLLFMAASRTA
ncbi:EamA family transporter, partial [Pseudomonas fragi]